MDRHRAGTQRVDVLLELRGGHSHAVANFLLQSLLAPAPDAVPDQPVGQQAALGQTKQPGGRTVLQQRRGVDRDAVHVGVLVWSDDRGNHGNNIGVVRW